MWRDDLVPREARRNFLAKSGLPDVAPPPLAPRTKSGLPDVAPAPLAPRAKSGSLFTRGRCRNRYRFRSRIALFLRSLPRIELDSDSDSDPDTECRSCSWDSTVRCFNVVVVHFLSGSESESVSFLTLLILNPTIPVFEISRWMFRGRFLAKHAKHRTLAFFVPFVR